MDVLSVFHVHSKWSCDGSWLLEQRSAKFGRQGYRVLMMTDHDLGFTPARLLEYRQACTRASSAEILLVRGIECSDAANRVHVLVWGDAPFLGEGLSKNEMLEEVKAANGLAVLANPSRGSAWTYFEPHWARQLLGIDVWNRKYDGWAPSQSSPALLQKSSAIPFVGLDFHNHRQSFPLAMALELLAAVTEETVLQCLRSRKCYTRAFGVPVSHNLVRTALPALGAAEQVRWTLASIARYARGLGR
jgi:hypothetical protein